MVNTDLDGGICAYPSIYVAYLIFLKKSLTYISIIDQLIGLVGLHRGLPWRHSSTAFLDQKQPLWPSVWLLHAIPTVARTQAPALCEHANEQISQSDVTQTGAQGAKLSFLTALSSWASSGIWEPAVVRRKSPDCEVPSCLFSITMVTVTMSQGSLLQPRASTGSPQKCRDLFQGNHVENTHCHPLKTFSFLGSHGCLKNPLPLRWRAYWWYSENCMCMDLLRVGVFLLVSRTKREKLLLSWLCRWVNRDEKKKCNYLSFEWAVINWTWFMTLFFLLPPKHKFKATQDS